MAQILDGYLHLVKNNIIHRDLKPENILISKNNYYISDFGFAKFIQ
jgi:serine/threonine protein kinase